ncbi:hypothetical protein Trydic_g20217 [Trypoxylus dichotomus]
MFTVRWKIFSRSALVWIRTILEHRQTPETRSRYRNSTIIFVGASSPPPPRIVRFFNTTNGCEPVMERNGRRREIGTVLTERYRNYHYHHH